MNDMKDPAAGEIAKLFWNGRSQAVRLPKAFRFEGDTVRIRRQGNAVVLEPVSSHEDGWAWLRQFEEPLDADFVLAVLEDVPQQLRPDLDRM